MHWIDQLNLWLNRLFTDPQWLFWTFTVGLGALAFLLFNLFFSYLQTRFNPVKDRIDAFAADAERSDIGGSALSKQARGERLLERLGRGFSGGDPDREDGVASRLAQVGYRRPRDLHIFILLKLLAALALPLATAVVLIGGGLMPLRLALPIIALTLFLGAILPDYWLTQRVKAHQAALRRGLPDVLDMLVVCSEAGLGLNAAIQRVALEMDIQHPAMADELKTT
ncbi:MAG: type II secretion system F family protein, partial [Gammaproteobacteria bacterium]|nr:type II secretion system F family protein [Gammaproteobacteria bacterium]